MKRTILILCSLIFITACGSSKSGKQIAEEVCDCSKKANGLPTSNPDRASEQAKCNTMNQEAWAKVKDDDKKAKEFNATISACATEQIKKSFGQ